MTRPDHPPTREAALRRLRDFVPHAGHAYAARRNFDLPGHPHVSALSPYIRHRLMTEAEVLTAVLARHSPAAAEKFVQEVFWRTYCKGWLEMRPGIWDHYRHDLMAALNRVATEGGLRRDWEAACTGQTGIAAFDHWAQELVRTGYLHNHARMWVASIWIFTLRLPWELGADFFLRHLLDGDAASNTLGWRWVAGLQTKGKHYLARAENIARYTEGRFAPRGDLDERAAPLAPLPDPPRTALPVAEPADPDLRTGLILTEDDLAPGFAIAGLDIAATLVISGVEARTPLEPAPAVRAFTEGAVDDCLGRYAPRLGHITRLVPGDTIADWTSRHGLKQIVLPHVPVGPARDSLAAVLPGPAGVPLRRALRPYDATCWPHATAGFFRFREAIPGVLASLGLADA